SHFPATAEQPYFLSLGPYAFHWFHLQPKEASLESLTVTGGKDEVPVLAAETAEDVFSYSTWSGVARLLPSLLSTRPWFLGRNRQVREVDITEVIPISGTRSYLIFIDVEYTDGDPDTYLIALSFATGERAEAMIRENRESVLAKVQGMSPETTVLYGAVFDREFSD